MKVIEYLRKKNSLIFAECGITLIPEDQLYDMEPMPLWGDSDSDICPYCRGFQAEEGSCENCPMSLAGNECYEGREFDDTYTQVKDVLGWGEPLLELEGMKELVYQYNTENGFEKV